MIFRHNHGELSLSKMAEVRAFERVNQEVRRILRKKNGRNEEPSAGIIDSQSVKGTAESAEESDSMVGKKSRGENIILL